MLVSVCGHRLDASRRLSFGPLLCGPLQMCCLASRPLRGARSHTGKFAFGMTSAGVLYMHPICHCVVSDERMQHEPFLTFQEGAWI